MGRKAMSDLRTLLNEDLSLEEQLKLYRSLNKPKPRGRVVNSTFSRARPTPKPPAVDSPFDDEEEATRPKKPL